ncbi:hypothetical protein ABT158_00840 [Nonomuraea sp. NPDC001636]|uniref:hypothetical protein n=1 Tax=Nonomuraea sp. NPDC001636 TaxID=3154391 RepID=UPI00332D18E2
MRATNALTDSSRHNDGPESPQDPAAAATAAGTTGHHRPASRVAASTGRGRTGTRVIGAGP